MIVLSIISTILILSLLSVLYVYQFRGDARYQNFNEYIRKGWPIFAPLNCLLYLTSQRRAKSAIANVEDFPELKKIQDNWHIIRDEALKLYEQGYFSKTSSQDSASYYDLGFRTFYKYGWSKFYITWYGHHLKSAKELCPKTLEIVKDITSVNGVMFSLLPAGSQLTRHLDPMACSLRYHLALVTPNDQSCFLNVDGKNQVWKDGEAFIFDETYLHYAKNDTPKPRLILMGDIDRPTFLLGSIINFFYKCFARMSVVPNLEGDKRGLINKIFSGLSPVFSKAKELKKTHPKRYFFLKHGVNTILFILILAIFYAVFSTISRVFF